VPETTGKKLHNSSYIHSNNVLQKEEIVALYKDIKSKDITKNEALLLKAHKLNFIIGYH
jgi:hypothetical protein